MMRRQSKRLPHPFLLVALVALLVLSARLAHAQQVPAQAASRPTQRVAVATHALARGAVITADDMEMRDTTFRGSAGKTPVGPGWITRRVIAAGEVLRTPAVEQPNLVTANQSVDVEWADKNVQLTLRGVATRNAALGEHVSVRTDGGRRVEATVVAVGRVRIDGGT